jgi:uncharacterized protein YdeI (YjbR/CyaY-like superfamily)
MNPKADWYFEKNEQWQKEIGQLRTIAIGCRLEETLKSKTREARVEKYIPKILDGLGLED